MSSEVQQILNSVRALSVEHRQELTIALEQAALIATIRSDRDRILSIQGKYAHVPASSEDFMARKHADLSLEH